MSLSLGCRGIVFLLGSIVLYACATVALAQYTRLDPDFRGMQGRGGYDAYMVRDSVSGWTYFQRSGTADAKVGGVPVPHHFRVSDAGQLDPTYELVAPQGGRQYIAGNGQLFINTASQPWNGVSAADWWRVVQQPDGRYATDRVSAAEAPAVREVYPSNDAERQAVLRVGGGDSISVRAAAGTSGAATLLQRTAGDGSTLWQHSLIGAATALAVDALGRVYVGGYSLASSGQNASILRFLPDGRIDTDWWFGTYGEPRLLRALDDRLVVVFPDYRLASFELGHGGKQSARSYSTLVRGVEIGADGRLPALDPAGKLHLLDTRSSDARNDSVVDIAYSATAPQVLTSAEWGDGYVLGGAFDFWFNGQRFRNLMRLDRNFQPDTSWAPPIEGAVRSLAVDRDGALVVGGMFTLGEHSNLLRFHENRALDTAWTPRVEGVVLTLHLDLHQRLVIAGNFGEVDGQPRRSIARFNTDGTLDAQWAPQVLYSESAPGMLTEQGVSGVVDVGEMGLIVEWRWRSLSSFYTDTYWARLAPDGTGAQVYPNFIVEPARTRVDAATGDIYTVQPNSFYNAPRRVVRLRRNDLTVDPTWGQNNPVGDPNTADGMRYFGVLEIRDGYVYACTDALRRYRVSDGQLDPGWNAEPTWPMRLNAVTGTLQTRGIPCTPNILPYVAAVTDDFLTWPQTLSQRTFTSPFDDPKYEVSYPAVRSRKPLYPAWPPVADPVRVIEYWASTARRFFMTSRANEIAALDALPQSFTRTGMQFDALNLHATWPPLPAFPVCRFYSPPAAGGSNTHFYGTLDYGRMSDCYRLKRYTALHYEGFDFGVALPTAGACVASGTIPVYRLFNKQAASNNGNHRYVVSAGRRTEMIAAGWADEGIAFCTTGASDSGALDSFLR